MISLGTRAKDRLTGFTGVIVGITQWLGGCVRYGIQAQKLKDEKPVDVEWFDDHRVEPIFVKKEKKGKIGGPQKDPRF